MARKLLHAAAALAPLVAAQVDLQSFGANKACRSSTPCIESSSNSCRDKYDVMILTTLQDCKSVCETLAASCTGIEWLTPGSGEHSRCEIWKAEIDHTVAATGFECFEDADNSTGTDGMLYFYFELETPNFNTTVTSTLNEAGKQLIKGGVAMAVAESFANTTGVSKVTGVTAAHMMVELDSPNNIAKVWMTPPAGQNPLIMFAALRPAGSSDNDGTISIETAMTTHITQQFMPILMQFPSMLKTGETVLTVNVKSKSRRLVTALPTIAPTPAPTTSPTPAPTGSPTPAPRSVNGAEGTRVSLLACVATVATAAMGMF